MNTSSVSSSLYNVQLKQEEILRSMLWTCLVGNLGNCKLCWNHPHYHDFNFYERMSLTIVSKLPNTRTNPSSVKGVHSIALRLVLNRKHPDERVPLHLSIYSMLLFCTLKEGKLIK